MLPNRAATAFCALLLCALALPSAADAALVTHFNFNSYTGGLGPISANSGTGTMTFSGIPVVEVTSVTGIDVNAVGADSEGNAVRIENNAGNTTNLTMAFNSQGYGNLQLSFAGQGSSATYTQAAVQYSINGIDFFNAAPPIVFDPADGGGWSTTGPINLSSVAALNNKATAYLRLVLTGANMNSTPQTLQIDNLQINGTAAPEAPALAMMAVALLLFGGVAYRRRRTAAGQTVHAQVLAA